ncbi:filamentous hemagglutinin family protein [Variovorax boronicumulans]|uniref:two-partner secretion domain-containing protein n=1 Tax=Variovorax boronicumulans TaxID=436515 RepID=UPI002786296C|nr:hemagglutinin repeat-containing protein [Variovorax boronicumulans]MDP9916768.1 filamentous hemagglutinin family protein [Variovorax boronicumulans]
MNHIYRIIWNAVSATWVAVAETARGHAKSSKAARRRRTAAMLGALALIPPVALSQVASVVVAPGSNLNAYVAPNGVTVVNINQANAAGLSHNQFQSFNVNPIGLILNNTTSAQIAWQSQLAGQITANFNQTNAARVILNEVVSNNRSTLAGFTEVLGGRADVVLANPYGITCSGCGFINTDRVTLTTGNPFLASNGGLGGFSVGQGDILITGTGLNATAQQVLDLVTRSVRIEAPVHGQEVSVVAGTNRWSYDTRAVSGAATPTEGAPVHAIDTAALGGMYANRIRMISTEAGVGVRMRGDAAASAGDFTLTAAGKVELQNRISASTDVSVATTAADRDALALTDASLTSTGKTTLAATGGVALSGGALVAGSDLSVSAESLLDTASASGNANNNLRRAGGALTLAVDGGASLGATEWSAGGAWNGNFGNLVTTGATRLYSSGGTLIASADKGDLALGLAVLQSAGNMGLSATGKISTAAGAGLQSRGGNLSLTAGNGISNAGTLTADTGAVLVRADGGLVNSGQIHAGQNLDIADRSAGASASLSNSGTLLAGEALALQAAAVTNSAGARIQAQSGSVVHAASIDNAGAWLLSQQAGAHDTLTTRGALTNSGTLQGAGAVAVDAVNAVNSGTLIAVADLNVTTASDFINSGIAQAGEALGLTSGGTISNTGTGVLKAASLDLAADKGLSNAGIATADSANARLRVDGTLDNSGQLHARLDIDMADRRGAASQAVVNSGKLLAERGLVLKAASLSNTATGWAQAAHGSTATLGTLDNAGTWLLSQQAGAKDQIDVVGTAINSGTLQSGGDLDVTAASLVNSGRVLSAGDLEATTAGGLTNAAGGALQAGAALTLTGDDAVRNAATATVAGRSVAISADNGFTNAGAVEARDGSAALRVNGTLDNSGTVRAAHDIDMADRAGTSTQTVVNSGTLLAGQAFALRARDITNTGRVQAYSGSTVAAGRLDNAGTWLLSQQANAADTVDVAGILTNSGTLQSAGRGTFTADSIANTGKLLAGGTLDARVTVGLRNDGKAVMQAGQQLSVQGAGAALVNTDGSQMLGDGLVIDVASLDNSGTVQGGGRADSTVSVGGTLTNGLTGVLTVATTSGGAGTVAATTIANDGKIQSGGALALHVGEGGLTSNGSVIAENDLALQSRSGKDYIATVNGQMQSSAGTLSVTGSGSSRLDIGGAATVVGRQLAATLGTIHLADGAKLSSDRDMTLTLGALSLAGSKAAVLGSTDQSAPESAPWTTRITTASALTNDGLLFSGNDLAVTAPSIANGLTGGIAALRNLSLTATTGDLKNQGALYAGEDLKASAESGRLTNAGTLTAYQGTISAGKSIALRANTLVNNSTIDSNGSITVTAQTLRNEVLGGDSRVYGGRHDLARTLTGESGKGYHGCGCVDKSEYWYYSQTSYEDQYYAGGTPTIKPQITGAGVVNLNFNTARNLGGSISGAVVNLTGTGSGASFVNDDLALQRRTYTRTWTEHTKYVGAGVEGASYYDRRIEDETTTGPRLSVIRGFGAGVYAGQLNASNFALSNNGSTAAPQDIKDGPAKNPGLKPVEGKDAVKGSVDGAATGTVAATAGTVIPVATLDGRPAVSFVAVNAANGVRGTAFGGIDIPLPSNPNGLYVIASAPGARYLVESNPRYQVGSSTVGSDYLSRLLGYDADALVRRLGDASYEAYLIKQQLIAQTGTALIAGAKNAGAQVQALMDSAAGESKTLGLVYGQALTPEQQAKLAHDIVWMVQTEIGGQVVLAPVVYLSPKTKANVTQGAVITADTADLNLHALTNTGGTIAAAQSLKVVSVGDVTNTSGTIKGGNVAIASTQGSIINQTAVSGSGNELRYETDIGKTASIQSTGTLSLNAAKDITNTGAQMAAGGDASLKAGGNVSFDTIQDKRTDTTRGTFSQDGGKGTTVTTTTTITQVKSGLSTGGNLAIDAGKDITLAGTDTKAGGNANLKAGGDLNLVARENSTTTHTESKASGFGMNNSLYGSTTVTSDSTSVRNVSSTLQVGGNASLAAGKDLTVQGSSVDVKGSGTVSATNVNVLAGRNYDETRTTTEQSGILQVSGSGGGAKNSDEGARSGGGRGLATGGAQGSGEVAVKAAAGLALTSNTTTQTETTDLKHVASTLNFGGDLAVNASKDVTLQGSTVNAGGNAQVNARNVNLLAAEDKSTSSTTTTRTTVGLMGSSDNKAAASASADGSASGGSGRAPNAKAGAQAEVSASSDNRIDVVQHSKTTSETLATTHQGSAIAAKGNLGIKATDTLTLEGSNLAAGGDLGIAAKDMQFKAVNDVRETRTSSGTTTAGLYVTGDAKASANAGAAGGLGAQAGASAKASAAGEIGLYGSNTRTGSVEGSTTAVTSGLSAGGNISRLADNAITDVGTRIEGGGNLTQSAKTITSLAAADTTYASSSTNTHTAKIGGYAEASAGVSAQAAAGPGATKPTQRSKTVGAGVRASYETDQASEQSASSTAVVSTIRMGGSVNSVSSGRTTLEGTNIAAGKDVTLGASSLDYTAARNTSSASSKSTSAGATVGFDMMNKEVSVGVDYAGSNSSQSTSTAVVGGIQAGGDVKVTTTGDARFEGTNVVAVGAAGVATGGKLSFDAAKNTTASNSESNSVAVEVAVGKSGAAGSGGVSHERSKSASSEDVAGSIQSGSGPLTIKSGGDATFTGTALASQGNVAVEAGGNLAFNAAHKTQSSESVKVDVSSAVSAGAKTMGATDAAGTGNAQSTTTTGATAPASSGKKSGGKEMNQRSGEGSLGVGKGEAKSDIATGGSITSGGSVRLSSGKDTTLEGTQVKAATGIVADAGGTFTQKDAVSTASSSNTGFTADAAGTTVSPKKAPVDKAGAGSTPTSGNAAGAKPAATPPAPTKPLPPIPTGAAKPSTTSSPSTTAGAIQPATTTPSTTTGAAKPPAKPLPPTPAGGAKPATMPTPSTTAGTTQPATTPSTATGAAKPPSRPLPPTPAGGAKPASTPPPATTAGATPPATTPPPSTTAGTTPLATTPPSSTPTGAVQTAGATPATAAVTPGKKQPPVPPTLEQKKGSAVVDVYVDNQQSSSSQATTLDGGSGGIVINQGRSAPKTDAGTSR